MQSVLENLVFNLSMNRLKGELRVLQSERNCEICRWAKAGKAQSGNKLQLRVQISNLRSTWFCHVTHLPAGNTCIQGLQGFKKHARCIWLRERIGGIHELIFRQSHKQLESSLLVLISMEIFQKCPPLKDSEDLQQIYCGIWEESACTPYLNISLPVKNHNSAFLKELHLLEDFLNITECRENKLTKTSWLHNIFHRKISKLARNWRSSLNQAETTMNIKMNPMEIVMLFRAELLSLVNHQAAGAVCRQGRWLVLAPHPSELCFMAS